MPDINNKSVTNQHPVIARRRRLAVVISVAFAVILVLFSAFVWPHWAPKSTNVTENTAVEHESASHGQQSPQPAVKAQPLPAEATDLLKAMPDSVGSFVRVKAEASADLSASSPLEEYAITYSNGHKEQDIVLRLAQWSQDVAAEKQYQSMLSSLSGKELASGKVKVSGKEAGAYMKREDPVNTTHSIVIWRNATVVFRLEGPKTSVDAFYKDFPL